MRYGIPLAVLILTLAVGGCVEKNGAPSSTQGPEGDAEAPPLFGNRSSIFNDVEGGAERSASEDSPQTNASDASPFRHFTVRDCACYEPWVHASDDALLLTSGWGTWLLRYDWAEGTLDEIPLPSGPPNDAAGYGSQSDAFVVQRSDGRLFYVSMVGTQIPREADVLGYGGAQYSGVRVAFSDDAGETWHDEMVFPAPGAPSSVPLADRPWLAFGTNDDVYLSFSQIPTGIYLAKSSDGGETFGVPKLVAGAHERLNIGQAGAPRVGDQIMIPHILRDDQSTWPVLAVSTDAGESFSTRGLGNVPRGANSLPVLASGPDGQLVYVWANFRGPVFITTSTDEGVTWSPPQVVSRDTDAAAASPWVVVQDDRVVIGYYTARGEGFDLVLAAARPNDPDQAVDWVVLASGLEAAWTDFAHFASGPDRRIAAVWADKKAGTVQLAVER